MIYGHGDDLHLYNGKIKYNFSSNVYYKGCPPELLEEISNATFTIQNYPSPAAKELNKAAANKFELNQNHFLFTNGATEAFYLIAHMLSGKSAAIVAPTFSEYEDACKIYGLAYRLIDNTMVHPEQYQVVFICNPNNPDGTIIPIKRLKKIIEEAPNTIFVIDEAYIEFNNQMESIIPLINRLKNLIVVRSLTKTFAIPGIRLGYIVASSHIIDQLLEKKIPWSVNALAIQAGLQIFKHYDQWLFDVDKLLEETKYFINELSKINWLEVKHSYTSYFLVELKKGTASSLKEYLATQHNILIRDATNFRCLEGEYIRLATQDRSTNIRLINALKHWK